MVSAPLANGENVNDPEENAYRLVIVPLPPYVCVMTEAPKGPGSVAIAGG
jgi:hypothetical protein